MLKPALCWAFYTRYLHPIPQQPTRSPWTRKQRHREVPEVRQRGLTQGRRSGLDHWARCWAPRGTGPSVLPGSMGNALDSLAPEADEALAALCSRPESPPSQPLPLGASPSGRGAPRGGPGGTPVWVAALSDTWGVRSSEMMPLPTSGQVCNQCTDHPANQYIYHKSTRKREGLIISFKQ